MSDTESSPVKGSDSPVPAGHATPTPVDRIREANKQLRIAANALAGDDDAASVLAANDVRRAIARSNYALARYDQEPPQPNAGYDDVEVDG